VIGFHPEGLIVNKPCPLIPHENSSVCSGCPFLQPAPAEWLWPVEGICRGRLDGRLMVPPVSHYLKLCTTGDHHLCEVFRARSCPLGAAA
jgi:hypothetical protein